MWRIMVERMAIEAELAAAWRRAQRLSPYSPEWDVAMGSVEDLERQLWRLDQANRSPRQGPSIDCGGGVRIGVRIPGSAGHAMNSARK